MFIYDSHCHLESINNLSQHSAFGVVPAVTLKDIPILVKFREDHPQYKIGFGIHPWYINSMEDANSLEKLEVLIVKYKPDFIGEIGIDYLKPDVPLQKTAFKLQLELAIKFNLPVVIHCVKAYNEVLAILKTYFSNYCTGQKPYGIIHAFNANAIIARQFSDIGFLLGIGSLVATNSTIAKSIQEIALITMVFESDAPFMGAFGKPVSDSSDTFLYAQIAAKRLNLNLIDLINQSNNNLLHLF